MPRLLELFCGTKSVGRAFEAAGWEVVSLDIVSKFEPTNPLRHPELGLHDVSVGALRRGLGQPGLHGIQPRADDAPATVLEGDALVLSALEIIAHFDPLMWVVENPATGLLKTRPFMERLPWVDVTYCKYGTPYRKQTRLWANMRWRPRRGLCRAAAAARGNRWQAPPSCAAGASADAGAVREGQPARELLYSVPAALCDEIARAATAELAERLSIPD